MRTVTQCNSSLELTYSMKENVDEECLELLNYAERVLSAITKEGSSSTGNKISLSMLSFL